MVCVRDEREHPGTGSVPHRGPPARDGAPRDDPGAASDAEVAADLDHAAIAPAAAPSPRRCRKRRRSRFTRTSGDFSTSASTWTMIICRPAAPRRAAQRAVGDQRERIRALLLCPPVRPSRSHSPCSPPPSPQNTAPLGASRARTTSIPSSSKNSCAQRAPRCAPLVRRAAPARWTPATMRSSCAPSRTSPCRGARLRLCRRHRVMARTASSSPSRVERARVFGSSRSSRATRKCSRAAPGVI